MALIEEVKTALRIRNTAFDDEIQGLIDACKLDLSIAGVKVIKEDEPLTNQAIKLYCKANFGYDDNSEKFAEAYLNLKQSMSLCGDYNEVVIHDETV